MCAAYIDSPRGKDSTESTSGVLGHLRRRELREVSYYSFRSLAKRRLWQTDLKALGRLISFMPVKRSTDGKERSYWYRLEFTKATVLQVLMLDADNRVRFSDSVDTHQKTQTAAKSSEWQVQEMSARSGFLTPPHSLAYHYARYGGRRNHL